MSIFSFLTGCGQGGTIQEAPKNEEKVVTAKAVENGVIDYADYPENFMIQLQPDTDYILKNGEEEIKFSVNTHALLKSRQVMVYGEKEYDISSAVYYRKSEPVLLRYNGKTFIWICEMSKDGNLSSTTFFAENDYGSFNQDNGNVNLKIGDQILDPARFAMNSNISCFGDAQSADYYTITENYGKPEKLDEGEEYYYVIPPYSEERLRLEDDINAWVYSDTKTQKAKVLKLPAGTEFKRYRVPIGERYSFVDGILDDGRVFRVVEEYWFSEPEAYQAMMDADKEQFSYSVVEK